MASANSQQCSVPGTAALPVGASNTARLSMTLMLLLWPLQSLVILLQVSLEQSMELRRKLEESQRELQVRLAGCSLCRYCSVSIGTAMALPAGHQSPSRDS